MTLGQRAWGRQRERSVKADGVRVNRLFAELWK